MPNCRELRANLKQILRDNGGCVNHLTFNTSGGNQPIGDQKLITSFYKKGSAIAKYVSHAQGESKSPILNNSDFLPSHNFLSLKREKENNSCGQMLVTAGARTLTCNKRENQFLSTSDTLPAHMSLFVIFLPQSFNEIGVCG